eukprot:COSAG06_NODE_55298_length_290_cov_0.811518_1_plen_93_part_10
MLLTVEKEGEDMARKMLALQGANKRLKEKIDSRNSELNDLRRTGTPRPNSDPIFEVMYFQNAMTRAQLTKHRYHAWDLKRSCLLVYTVGARDY